MPDTSHDQKCLITKEGEILVQPITNNMQKYSNYKEQMGRLSKAINQCFYLEALFIEYAIIEDRTESILRHTGIDTDKQKYTALDGKLKKLADMAREKKGLLRKYFAPEIWEDILAWKEQRNKLIHALMKQSFHSPDLEKIVMDGLALVKVLNNKSSLYNRAVDKANQISLI